MSNAWHGKTDIAFTDMCGKNPMKYHPGAVAAWEEAGYTLLIAQSNQKNR